MPGSTASLLSRWTSWRRVNGFTVVLDAVILLVLVIVLAATSHVLAAIGCVLAAANLALDSLALVRSRRP
ncbi:hypothetical protein ACEZCY_05060 [Streptacidiphilus sp. N1-12]|uniref:DUF3566 domain-containing protein n=2 Tax=Streptacidiphilus alkalitolerans TaxID=3342712 RepID=A0ABV6XDB7_9ACTN